jgi:hypothetical protein
MVTLHERLQNSTNATLNATKYHDDQEAKADFTFAILLIWTAIFSLYHILVRFD